ncbi:MAG TPA: hypothetical protein VFQ20_06995 [Burkholderiaceae bacterium]|nr:hypothetical protein [Burkholderiaceae bacterium]
MRRRAGALWESVTDGWGRLRQPAAGALTRHRPGDPSDLPTRDEIDDASDAYRHGVRRIELPEQGPGKPSVEEIRVS